MRTAFLACALALATVAGAQSVQPTRVVDAAQRAANLRVQPGDRIAIHILREPELSETVTVNERGEAAFAKLGILMVQQFTIGQLQDTLRVQYGNYLRNPALEVVVLRRIAVNGEVRKPDVYLVDVSTSLRDIIAKAGGIAENGSRGKVYIVREGERLRVRGWDRAEGAQMDLRSGDQVLVGRKHWLVINALSAATTAAIVTSVLYSITRN